MCLKNYFEQKERYTMDDLLKIMEILRGETGCPWDREQDHHSIRNNLIEETYEAVEAIDTENTSLMLEELGDVLLQVVFHARIEEEHGSFDFAQVCDGVCKKLLFRHPHVFSDAAADDASSALENWNQYKKIEKHQQSAVSTLEAVSKSLPALMRSQKVLKRASVLHLAPDQMDGALQNISDTVSQMQADKDILPELTGRLLLEVVNLARVVGLDAEEALYRTTDDFISRAAYQEQGK